MKLQFEQIHSDFPYELLLLADETLEAIDRYLFQSEVFLVKWNTENVSIFCLYEINLQNVELKNIAIAEKHQNQGLGGKILEYIKEISKPKYQKIIVGTGDSSFSQIRFYERNSFKKFGIRENFFLENYPEPIIENGVHLKDMVLLKFEF